MPIIVTMTQGEKKAQHSSAKNLPPARDVKKLEPHFKVNVS